MKLAPVTVIRDGAYVGTKKTSETNPNELVAMMVGRDLESFYARDYCDMDKAEVALEVKNLSQTGVFEDISFSVHKGEILGFSGLVGAGRSEIMEAVFGATQPTSGEVILGGKLVHFKNPMQAIKSGVALVPEDRKKQGLVLGNSVAFNLTLSSLRFYMNGIAIKFGTYVYAIGGNREAARLSGVPIKKIEIIVFTISGLLSAFAGLVLCSRMYSGQPSVGSGYELDAIAACVLGGTSMTGGKGRISGTVFGAMVIGIISNGLNLIGVSSYWQLIIKGLIIACAVLLDGQKGKLELLKKKKLAAN